ncbi:hypothetical protein [Actinoplanes sp. NPDC026619]|uniref:hypothetical protein n=1 Tax=Actinoplanes sp. NPDC026619 TaxID=3155798 RepID=UPI003404BF86
MRMRAHAYAENRRLEDIARDVVSRRLRLDGNNEQSVVIFGYQEAEHGHRFG